MSDSSDVRKKFRAVALLLALGDLIIGFSGASAAIVSSIAVVIGVILGTSWSIGKSSLWKLLP